MNKNFVTFEGSDDIVVQHKSFSHHLQGQRTEISFSAHRQGVNDIFSLKSITVSSFSYCQKYEVITVKTLQ